MLVSTPVLKLPGRHGNYKWPKVQEACYYFFPHRSDYIEAHRAYDDAVHEAEIVYELYQRGYWNL